MDWPNLTKQNQGKHQVTMVTKNTLYLCGLTMVTKNTLYLCGLIRLPKTHYIYVALSCYQKHIIFMSPYQLGLLKSNCLVHVHDVYIAHNLHGYHIWFASNSTHSNARPTVNKCIYF